MARSVRTDAEMDSGISRPQRPHRMSGGASAAPSGSAASHFGHLARICRDLLPRHLLTPCSGETKQVFASAALEAVLVTSVRAKCFPHLSAREERRERQIA